MSNQLRIVFMGTPDFAAASLQALLENNYNVVGVFTQPDRPRGRGMELSFSPVKELAVKHQLPVFQPEKMRDGTALSAIQALQPDILVVVAYGRLLPDDILAAAPLGAINVHGSLLPKYRGAAPIQWAVLNGERVTGVSTMHLASEMDSGDVIYQSETEIREKETSGELFDRLMQMGAELLLKTLDSLEAGTAPRSAQNHAEATYTRQLDKSICPIDFHAAPRTILSHIFGLQPWPVATMEIQGKVYRVFDAELTTNHTDKPAGTILTANDAGIEIACGEGDTICITELQAPGKKRMRASDFLRGHKLV